MLTALLASTLIAVCDTGSALSQRVEACLTIPDRGTDMASDKPSGGLTLAWTQGEGGRSVDSATLLSIVRRQEAAQRILDGQAIVIQPSGGLAGANLFSLQFTLPATTIPPIGVSMAQLTACLQDVSDYFAEVIQTQATVRVMVLIQPLPNGTNTATSIRTGFLPIADVVDTLRTSGDLDSGPSLPAITTVFPVRYTGSSITITNESRICLTTANSRTAAPLSIPNPAHDARISIGSNVQWDTDPSDGLALPGGIPRYSMTDHVIREVCGTLGWLTGVDFLVRDLAPMDLYRFCRDFTLSSGTAFITDFDARDYNPGNGTAVGAGANIVLKQFGTALAAPIVDPTDADDDGEYYWYPITLEDADLNANGILNVGEGETGVSTFFPRLVSKNQPNGHHILNFVKNSSGVTADKEWEMYDGQPIRGSCIVTQTLDSILSRPLMGVNIPKGVSWWSRSGDPLAFDGDFPDYLTSDELLVLDSLGWDIDPAFDSSIAE
ncbi:MAG: hypothetical protein EXS00_06815 [Phycisphaerales bacterium]|nr:hypothetical protein [Phycisphaerales bacterium]